MMFSKKIFSDNMKQLRQGKTQAEAAKAVGLSQQGWARYESGKVLPGAEAIHQICSTFGITSDWLLGLSPTRAPTTGGGPSVNAGSGAAVNIGSGSATAGGDCSKCRLMQDHIRQITGRA